MNRILSVSAMLACAFFIFSSFSIRENPQDPPRGKKKEKHIKIEKIDDQGNKTEIDTIIKGDDFFVWNGDTIGNHKGFSWFSGDDFDLDSLHEKLNFDIELSNDDDGNVFIMKSGKSLASMMYEFRTENDSIREYEVKIIHGEDGEDSNAMIWHKKDPHGMIHVPKPPVVPHVPGLMYIGKGKSGNVIDLSDPGIISFKKRKMSGGREKITIIRNEPKDEDVVKKEEIIVTDDNNSAIWHSKAPGKAHAVHVTTDVDGKVEVIKEDNKIIRITENKKGDEKEVKVNVEVETEKENN